MAKVIITDDAAFMRMILKDGLTKKGFECYEAANGVELLERLKEVTPDLITLDITMPTMDGLEALKALKKLGITVPVIMCSAMGQQSMVIDALMNGALDFVVKPFDMSRVYEAVDKVLKK